MTKDEWEDEFKKWKSKKEQKIVKTEEAKKVVSSSEKIENSAIKEGWKKVEVPAHIKLLKVIILAIPAIILIYLIINNSIISQYFEYKYDIGKEGNNYLSPLTRISEIGSDGEITYRNLTSGLVYFDVPIARGSEIVDISVKMKDNFPEGWTMSLGAKDQAAWHYTYNSIYNPALDALEGFDEKDGVYRINFDKELLNEKELKRKSGIVIATDTKFQAVPSEIYDYVEKLTVINTTLRGGHTFYIYTKNGLEINVKKQDLNWYANSDEVELGVYDLEDNLIANATIPDDGIIDVSKKATRIQEGTLKANGLKEGIYKLEISDADVLIREIRVNSNKIVAESLFLADNEVYNVKTTPSTIYFEPNRYGQIRLITYHSAGLQKVTMDGSTFNLDVEDEPIYLDVEKGAEEFTFMKNDVKISGNTYFAFSQENYFEPFKQRVVPIGNDILWIENNVDYLITDYSAPVSDDGWIIANTSFNIKKDNLFVKDNKLSVVFNTPHLSNDDYSNMSIPIEWIDIKVYKSGVFG